MRRQLQQWWRNGLVAAIGVLVLAAQAHAADSADAAAQAIGRALSKSRPDLHFGTPRPSAIAGMYEVQVIDATTWQPVKAIAGFDLPWGIVTYPKADGSLDAPAK